MSENTTEPTIADNKPAVADLTAGEEYHWCACGRSSNQPFCDGSHVGTEFTPKAFTAETDGAAHLCACKRTGNAPYCDGSHKGTGLQPVKFEVATKTTVWWCQCKRTGNPPLCDGSHKKLG